MVAIADRHHSQRSPSALSRAGPAASPGRRRVNKERLAALQRRRRRVVFTLVVLFLALLAASFLLYGLLPPSSPYDEFAACLSERGAVMYGSDWCEDCQAQKRLFGTSFSLVAYENCDYSRMCEELGLEELPAWRFGDGSFLPGLQSLSVLSEKSGCPLPSSRG